MTKQEKILIKEQRNICQKNNITFKFKKLFDEWWLFVPKNYTEDFKQLGYNNIDSIDNF